MHKKEHAPLLYGFSGSFMCPAEDEMHLHTAGECFKECDQHKSVTKTELWNNNAAEKSWLRKKRGQKDFLNGAQSAKGERLELGWKK